MRQGFIFAVVKNQNGGNVGGGALKLPSVSQP
jgi:hypothetical protein